MADERTDVGDSGAGRGGLVRLRRLVVVYSPGAAPPPLPLGGTTLAIGREPGPGGLSLDDSKASRRHALLELEADRWSIADLGSSNGTVVDGVRVERAPLAHGSVIRIGRSLLVFIDQTLGAFDPLRAESINLRGGSVAMQRLRGELALFAPRAEPVLVLGESGAGKEQVARELHELSGRRGRFVAVNCAAIAGGIADSELFGHVAGAFTGAVRESAGLFAAADGGTLFLDEVGELPAELQPKLLRAVATGEVRAIGRADARHVDVRIVAATNRDVAAEIPRGGFRGDLYARLAAFTLQLAPLRDRRDDVLILARLFLDREDRAARLSPGAAEALLLHDWPFNVRELENAVLAAAVRAGPGGTIRCEHLPPPIAARVRSREESATPTAAEVPLATADAPSADELRRAFAHFGGNIERVAGFFGKNRKQIYRWLERHGLDVAALRKPDDAD